MSDDGGGDDGDAYCRGFVLDFDYDHGGRRWARTYDQGVELVIAVVAEDVKARTQAMTVRGIEDASKVRIVVVVDTVEQVAANGNSLLEMGSLVVVEVVDIADVAVVEDADMDCAVEAAKDTLVRRIEVCYPANMTAVGDAWPDMEVAADHFATVSDQGKHFEGLAMRGMERCCMKAPANGPAQVLGSTLVLPYYIDILCVYVYVAKDIQEEGYG